VISIETEAIAQSQGQELLTPWLFENVSLAWRGPGVHVVMGSSGGGKSSLLKTLGGVWKPRRGRLLLNGRPLWAREGYAQDAGLLAEIGFAFQNNALFGSLRVIENLTFPHRCRHPSTPESERRELAQSWLAKVGLEAAAPLFPHELSGGMQKRLSIARCLMLKPTLIFLDDPTAGLDPITSRQMAELVKELLRGLDGLIVIVTNDPDRARDWGPNIHFLADRELHSPGSPRHEELGRIFL